MNPPADSWDYGLPSFELDSRVRLSLDQIPALVLNDPFLGSLLEEAARCSKSRVVRDARDELTEYLRPKRQPQGAA